MSVRSGSPCMRMSMPMFSSSLMAHYVCARWAGKHGSVCDMRVRMCAQIAGK